MTLGAGIVWSTIIALIAIAIWRTTVNKKWKTVGKVFGGLILLGAIIGICIWGWSEYEDRPRVVTELAGVTLGMSPVEVTLALGEPAWKVKPEDGEEDTSYASYAYTKSYDKEYSLAIFFDESAGQLKAVIVCEDGGNNDLLGFGSYSSESDVIEKLGKPGTISIHKSGLKKVISYPQLKAAFQIEKGDVTGVCTSVTGKVEFSEEFPSITGNPYDQFSEPTKKPLADDVIWDPPDGN